MKKIILSFLIAHGAFLIAQLGVAQIIHVPADQPTIQAGINASGNGDTVLVAEGTYYENLSLNGKAITLASLYLLEKDPGHIENTVIDGSQPANPDLGAVITLECGEDTNTIIHGFTIRGGTGSYYPPFSVRGGGGIILFNTGATIEFNHIEYNTVTHYQLASGGAISQGPPESQAWLIIRGNRIEHNSVESTQSGYYAQGGGIVSFCNTILTGNIIRYNECKSSAVDCYGGGAFLNGVNAGPKELRMTNNEFSNNKVSNTTNKLRVGGGLDARGYYGYIGNNLINSNEIASFSNGYCWGAGVSFSEIADGLLFENNVVAGNFVTGDGNLKGGGIYIETSDVTLKNNLIEDHNASYGGGMNIGNNTTDTVELINNTIINNSASVKGGGVYTNMAAVALDNCILWDNDAPSDPEISFTTGYLAVDYSDVEGGWTGTGNVNSDPLFRAPDEGDFRLTENSPCVDTGDPMLASDPDATRPDIGCYPFFQGTRIHVKQDGTGNFSGVQEAIEAVTPGDSVVVYEGTYFENIDFKGQAFTLASEYLLDGDESHIDNTVLDGSHATDPDRASVVMFSSGEDTNSVLHGFTVTGGSGTFVQDADVQLGGGVVCINAGAKLTHNNIVDNQAIHTSAFGAGGAGIGTFSETGDQWLIAEHNYISGNVARTNSFTAFAGGIGITINAKISNNVIENNSCVNLSTLDNTFADGAGIEVEFLPGQEADVSITGNVIQSNTLQAQSLMGAGISLLNAFAHISGNTISQNSGTALNYCWGGGIYSYKAPEFMEISYNEITGNLFTSSHAYGTGMEIFQNEGEISLLYNHFENNFAEVDTMWLGSGGIVWEPFAPVHFTRNDFTGNSGTYNSGCGGGLMLQLANDMHVSLDGNRFIGNDAAKGGGMYNRNSYNLSITNNIFSGNSSNVRGGAINNYRTADDSGREIEGAALPVIVNNTFTENYCDSIGGAICDNYSFGAVIFNNIFWNDYAKHGAEVYYHGTDILNIHYCDIDPAKIYGSWQGGNNFNADPQFIDDALHIDQGSPCADAGADSLEFGGTWYYAPDVDFEGSPRPFGNGIDIGADEWPAISVPEPVPVIGKSFDLFCYPNPTGGIVNCQLSIVDCHGVSLKIYDLHGREVGTVMDQVLPAGEHSVQFDVSGLPAGIYILRMIVDCQLSNVNLKLVVQ